jgi:cytochrome c2
MLFESKACVTCHTLPGIASATGTVGPPLAGIANTAGTRKPGMAAEAYLRESIENPNAFVVPGFPSPSAMPPGQATGQEVADLVAFLLTQR